MHLAAVGAPAGVAAVLLDQDRHRGDLDLLDDAHVVAGGPQAPAAVGADLHEVVMGRGVEPCRRDAESLVLGVPRLAAGVAPLLARGRRGLGRLDDVGGGRLGGGRGVLARGGELRVQLGHGGLEPGHRRGQGIDLRLQALAVGTGGRGFGSHAALFYDFQDQRHYPVNRYAGQVLAIGDTTSAGWAPTPVTFVTPAEAGHTLKIRLTVADPTATGGQVQWDEFGLSRT